MNDGHSAGPRVGGRYELGALLGRGGMAEVRQATDLRLGRTVAVKRLRTDLAADPTFQARFRREAQSAAGLNHPNIVSVYDTGEEMAPDGSHVQPYIVMEYVAGRTLREVLNDGRKVLPERALEIVSGVLAALDYSHRGGIIHRDIKPANVMLTPSGDIKVMDFGIARAISDGTSTVTQTQAVVGTAQYLSPEQARGESVDSRSDVYSTGCLLYELLVGRPPFVGDSPFSVAYQHVREQADPPSAHNPDVPHQIDMIVMRALAKRVEDRYQSAADMRADIQRYLEGQPLEGRGSVASPPPVVEPTSIFAPTPGYLGESGTADDGGQATSVSALPPDDGFQEEKRRRWPAVLLVILALALLGGGIAAAVQLFGEEAPAEVQVPRVVGLTLNEAEQRLQQRGLDVGEVNRENSDEVRRGQVMEQDPAERATLIEGESVDLTVSSGQEMVIVPFLLGDQANEARSKLDDRGLLAEEQERDSDEAEGTVIETDPVASERIPVGSTVTLIVSTGPAEVPGVVGRTEQQAVRRIEDAGLRADIEYDEETPSDPGLVLDQDPEQGEEVVRGSAVAIVVSRFDQATAEPSPTPDQNAGGGNDGGGGGDSGGNSGGGGGNSGGNSGGGGGGN